MGARVEAGRARSLRGGDRLIARPGAFLAVVTTGAVPVYRSGTMVIPDDVRALDAADPLAGRRARFAVPEGMVYLDGNSLGVPPRTVDAAAQSVLEEWRSDLIGGWRDDGWWMLPSALGDRLGGLLLGAGPGQVVVSDTVTVNLFKVLHAALDLRPDRPVIVVEASSFPTDRYVVDAVAMQRGRRVRVVPVGESVAESLDDTVAVAVLNHVDFRTGAILDMATTTTSVHGVDALAVWDLSHSAGVLELDLDRCRVDFAVGCTYKYVNAGPGAPAYLYASARHVDGVTSPIPGWIGHRDPFAMVPGYVPEEGPRRFLTGTHSVVALRLVAAALDAYEGVSLRDVRAKSIGLTSLFIDRVDDRCAGFGFSVMSPRDPARRGSQVSLHHADAPARFDRLVAAGVRGDFRPPDLLRFGFAPLYTSYTDVWQAVEVLADVGSGGDATRAVLSER